MTGSEDLRTTTTDLGISHIDLERTVSCVLPASYAARLIHRYGSYSIEEEHRLVPYHDPLWEYPHYIRLTCRCPQLTVGSTLGR